jgi:lysophospholipase L1-like esterase
MVAKGLVAILAGFAIAIPSTFWLLKKVRIKSKIRHFQVSTALGMPIALFTYLLQTSFVVPVIVITFVVSLLVVALELTLRSLISKSPDKKVTFDKGKNGTFVPFEEARAAAGTYPDDYMTQDFWLEMKRYTSSRGEQKQKFKSENRDFNIQQTRLDLFSSINFRGGQYEVKNGRRFTTDPPRTSDRKLFCLGNSTTFCEEVPDRLTYPSFLQRKLNAHDSSIEVINSGAAPATLYDAVGSFSSSGANKLSPRDIVVILFGVNECGWISQRSGARATAEIWVWLKALAGLANFGFQLATWLYLKLSPLSFRKFSRSAVNETLEILTSAFEYYSSQGVEMIAVLQPNIYTLRSKSEYERKLERRFSQDMKTLVKDAYARFEFWIKSVTFGISATHIFDNSKDSIFLDWTHANARGNELIAKFIFDELKKRNLISVDEEV